MAVPTFNMQLNSMSTVDTACTGCSGAGAALRGCLHVVKRRSGPGNGERQQTITKPDRRHGSMLALWLAEL